MIVGFSILRQYINIEMKFNKITTILWSNLTRLLLKFKVGVQNKNKKNHMFVYK